MKKVLIIHGLNFHYHMIGSLIEQLQDFDIDLLLPDEVEVNPAPHERFEAWDQICCHVNLKYNRIGKIIPNQRYDYCVLGTDVDKVGYSYYKKYYNGTPTLVIQHVPGKIRDEIESQYKRSLWLLAKSHDYLFFGFHYMSIDRKMQLLSPRISVVVIGNSSQYIENTPYSFEQHVVNFKDIDFYIVHWEQPRIYTNEYTNVKYIIRQSAETLISILVHAHYVWFYTSNQLNFSSGTNGAYTTLCRCILHDSNKNQSNIKTPAFEADKSRFEIAPLTLQDVIAVSNERDYLVEQSTHAIRRRLIGDPIICDGNNVYSNS